MNKQKKLAIKHWKHSTKSIHPIGWFTGKVAAITFCILFHGKNSLRMKYEEQFKIVPTFNITPYWEWTSNKNEN